MPTLHALLVGINAYPVSPLSGCLNDVAAMEAYLRKTYEGRGPSALRIQRITDADETKPTRQNIIDGFGFFKKAEAGDVCLFYYSGHGSFSKAPDEFWTERDGYLESFVCTDSRLPGGRDLMNKEMGYLISKALEGKQDVQFVAITDCCHAGTITKALTENKWTERSFVADFTPKKLEDYLGFTDTINGRPAYKIETREGKKTVTVQQARHIHLAASQEAQKAKELMIDGRQHGAFTYSMLKTLYGHRGTISYEKLMASVAVQVADLVTIQDPKLNFNGGLNETTEKKKYFLLDTSEAASPLYNVYRSKKWGWCIAAGAIHGASVGDTVVIDGVCETKIIDQHAADYSVLLGKPQLGAAGREYEGRLFVEPAQKVKLAFADELPAGLQQQLLKAYRVLRPVYAELVTDGQPKYFIRSSDKGVFIALPGSNIPLFDYTAINSEAEATAFFTKVASVANWLHLLEVANPATSLSDKDYAVTLFRKAEANMGNPSGLEPVTDGSKPVELRYWLDGSGQWQRPSLQVILTNRSNRDLWFSCLYMGVDYSVNDTALKEVRLPAGRSTPVSMIDEDGLEHDALKLEVEDELMAKGYNDITEYLKIFVSNQRVDTSKFAQEGLVLANIAEDLFAAARPKGLSLGAKSLNNNDWKTETIGLHIVRPKEAVPLQGGEAAALNGVVIQAPVSFSALVSLTSSQQETATAKSLANDRLKWNAALQPYPLLPQTRSASVVDVLELTEVKGAEAVTAENALVVQLPTARDASASSVIPLGLDAETGLYFPVGFVDADNNVHIQQLPAPTSSTSLVTAKSLFGSIRIYFQKVVSDWWGRPSPYPRLAIPEFRNGRLEYNADSEDIKDRVAKAGDVLLMVHGIIGDTKGMALSLKAVLEDMGKDETEILPLAFDYENLGTSITQTAADLKKALEEVGLQEGHGKKLVIVAHSMGGLVSRWFIEKLGGENVVSHLVMYGTPNMGTPWADVRDMAQAIITYGVNGAAFLQPWLFVLSGVGRLVKGTQVTFQEMDAETGIYDELNDGKKDPGIGYAVVCGNTQDIVPGYVKTASLLSRIFGKAKHAGYGMLDTVLFGKPNDIAVSVDSIQGIPHSTGWKFPPKAYTVACDHLNYFSTKDALTHLGI